MGFWWFMFFSVLLIPVVTIIAGWMMWKHCPKKINFLMGYRTPRSMINMNTWRFAHEYCGQLWWKLGWLMLIPSAVILILLMNHSESAIGGIGAGLTIIQCAVLVASIFPTERALKATFDENGMRR
jgi:hypothetical protein